MTRERVLLVDDEPGIRATLSEILNQQGFRVTTAATVSQGLEAMAGARFDALISDLNIGEPGDGFTLVSAMRRSQPDAITLIITGFPAFDTALEAIRNQVDGYLIKPTKVAELVDLLRSRLERGRAKHQPLARKRVSEVLRENRESAVDQWRELMRAPSRPPWSQLSDGQLVNHLPVLLDEICSRVDHPCEPIRPASLQSALQHGRLRKAQEYSVNDLLFETRILRQVVLKVVHTNLMSLNLSYVFSDLVVVSATIDELVEAAVTGFMEG
jgi:YesN/AraC family two-component response regulator